MSDLVSQNLNMIFKHDFISVHYVPIFFQRVCVVSNFATLRKVFLTHRFPWNLVKSLGKVSCTQQAVRLCSWIRLWVARSEVPRSWAANRTLSQSWLELKSRIAPRLTRLWVWNMYDRLFCSGGRASRLRLEIIEISIREVKTMDFVTFAVPELNSIVFCNGWGVFNEPGCFGKVRWASWRTM